MSVPSILIVDDGRKLGFHSWHLVPRTALLGAILWTGYLGGAIAIDADQVRHHVGQATLPTIDQQRDRAGEEVPAGDAVEGGGGGPARRLPSAHRVPLARPRSAAAAAGFLVHSRSTAFTSSV